MVATTSMERISTNIEGVYSTFPRKITDPRLSHSISISNNESLGNDQQRRIMQKRMHIILCYKKQSNNNDNEDNGLFHYDVGGWKFKETLGNALLEHPILAGRLRRSENNESLEIVSNDSGIRCVDAQIPLTLLDFLQSSKDKKNEIEAKLLFWKDVDTNPSFSPLFYIQVTKFQCGGYSIGISYSLLLTDPSYMAKFLSKWANIHTSLAYESEVPKVPLSMYTSPFNTGCPEFEYGTIRISSGASRKISKTIIFNISTAEKIKSGDEICKNFMLLCLEEVESKFGNKMSSNFTLITKEPNGDGKVEILSKQAKFAFPKNLKYEINSSNWDDLRMNEVVFQRENGPVHASHWIACDALEGMVLAVISNASEGNSAIKVYITFPYDQDSRT